MSTKSLLSSVKITAFSQIVVFIIMAIRVIVIPNNTSIVEFGLFQAYLLYIPYISFLTLGFNDGFYLSKSKNSKKDFKNDDYISPLIFFAIITFIQFAFSLFVALFIFNVSYTDLIVLVIINIPIVLTYNFFTYYLQISERVYEYNLLLIFEKVLFIALIALVLVFGQLTFFSLVVIDIIAKLTNSLLSIIVTRKELFTHRFSISYGAKAYYALCGIGFKIMIASFLSLVVFSLPRLIAEQSMEITSFSYFSFIFSIASIAYALFSAVSVIIFPHIMKKENLDVKNVFDDLTMVYSMILPILFLLTLPITTLIGVFVPSYLESAYYIAVVFFIISANIKTVMVINTMYKVTLKKNLFLIDNIITISFFLILNAILKNKGLLLDLFAIFLVYKVYLIEIVFRFRLKTYINRSFIVELGVLIVSGLYFYYHLSVQWIVISIVLICLINYPNFKKVLRLVK